MFPLKTKLDLCSDALPTLRVCRQVTSLIVYPAFPFTGRCWYNSIFMLVSNKKLCICTLLAFRVGRQRKHVQFIDHVIFDSRCLIFSNLCVRRSILYCLYACHILSACLYASIILCLTVAMLFSYMICMTVCLPACLRHSMLLSLFRCALLLCIFCLVSS